MGKIVPRLLQRAIERVLFRGKVVILYWPRQVGKTFLVKKILENYPKDSVYYSCDEPDILQALTGKTSTALANFFGNKKLVILDEAQAVPDIWKILKLMVDQYPDMQIIATGSSSFDIANRVQEPLTGRKYEFLLLPPSFEELQAIYSPLELQRILENRMILGMYPDLLFSDHQEAIHKLKSLSDSYLYKDILIYSGIKKPAMVNKLLQALALQVGNDVSYNELANLLEIDKKTVEYYIDLLQKSYVVFVLPSLHRNMRNELKKSKKIYFYDVWIRNILINNLNGLGLRQDVWALWENFCIAEFTKKIHNHGIVCGQYFWRTQQQKEIDYIQEQKWAFDAYECKRTKQKTTIPKDFAQGYPKSTFTVITKENFLKYIL